MNFNTILKNMAPHLVAVPLFLLVCLIFFHPMLKGYQLYQHDIVMVRACSQEIWQHRAEHGEEPLWTGSQFSGMPTFGIDQRYPKNFIDYVEKAVRLGIPRTMGMIFLVFLSFYLLMLSFKVNPWIAILGALAFGLSTYWYIALGAGHTSKIRAVDFMAVVLAGTVMAYRGRILWGAAVAGIGTALQVHATHFQITYYLLIILGTYGLFEFLNQFFMRPYHRAGQDYLNEKNIKPHELRSYAGRMEYFKAAIKNMWPYVGEHFGFKEEKSRKFWLATAALIVAGLIGGATNAGKMLSMKEYGDETIRGKASELSAYQDAKTGDTGLDKYYALSWSYGVMETWNLMIPNFHGGASQQALKSNSHMFETFFGQAVEAGQITEEDAEARLRGMPLYWGEQTFTSGPVYIGVIMCFLFIFGLLTLKGHYKYWLFYTTAFAFLLAWGINLEGFNVWMLNNLPFYNKFRAVSMTLVIAQVTIPIMAILALSRVFEKPTYKGEREDLAKKLYIAAGIAGGFLLLWWLMGPMFFDFKASGEKDQMVKALGADGYDALIKDRIRLFRMDCLRGLALVLVFGGIMLAWLKNLVKAPKLVFILALAAVVLIDMVPVTLRYMSSDKFQPELNLEEEFPQTTGDRVILANEKAEHYRVWYNNPQAAWKDASVSFRHKSVGGYSAVKLRKYQELFEQLMAGADPRKETNPAKRNLAGMLNMLNAKWVLIDGYERDPVTGQYKIDPQSQQPIPKRLPNGKQDKDAQPNPGALGNAWFVSEVKQVDSEDAVINEMRTFDPGKTAVINTNKVGDYLSGFTPGVDSTATIKLDSYEPNHMVYSYSAAKEQFAVFSEIYYPHGWNVTVDGKEAKDYVVTNYVLRGMRLPAGNHTVEFDFHPQSFYTGGNISLIFSLLTILGFLGLTALETKNWTKRIEEEEQKAAEEAAAKAEARKKRRPSAKRKPKA